LFSIALVSVVNDESTADDDDDDDDVPATVVLDAGGSVDDGAPRVAGLADDFSKCNMV
jgi:hypothetical protein